MQEAQNNFQTEFTFAIESEADLISCFRLKDQKKLILPKDLKFPLRIRSYFTWKEPSGVYVFLVFKLPNWDQPRGMFFKRVEIGGEPTGRLCGWCNAYGNSMDIGLLSVSVNANTSFSYLLCNDLRCIEKIEESATLAGKNPEKWIHQLYHRMGKFYEEVSNYKSGG